MNRGSRHQADAPVIASLVDTSKSTIKMLVELWYALWHEAHH
jgi:hypothetical protein